ncbi:hypothetical protein M9H77_24679 [Catharanthus roseus]|uniref:Uncharacterized protein n=1 Tax=Catharanthus roseus TaxID=4058 RepID=A0ACC0A535_CATRO|nr:hypothetical protein M9H77_24679 [Catharanthus roseus]
MWDWWCNNNNKHHHHNHPFSLPFLNHHHQNLLPIQIAQEEDNDAADGTPSPPHNNHPLSAFAMILTSWLRRSASRYLILALCTPLLLPLFCATFPFLCALEVFFRLCRRRRRRKRRMAIDGYDGDRMHYSEDGENGGRLLHRYLEDQLILVAGSVYECGEDDDEEDDGVDVEYFDNTSPSLQ